MPLYPATRVASTTVDRGAAPTTQAIAASEGSHPAEKEIEQRSEDGTEVFPSSPATLGTDTPDAELAAAADPRKPLSRRAFAGIRWYILDQWFMVGICCLVLLSSQVQVPASQQSKKELVCTYLCVAVIFIVTGCTLPTRALLENYSRWKLHLFVQSQTFLMTSAVVYAIVSICATNPRFMDPALLVGMIFTGCVPTTISSNVVMTRQAHGNTALTVVQSTLGNFLGPFLSPLLIIMYNSSGAWYTAVLPSTGTGDFSAIYRRVFMQLGLSIFLPMVCIQALALDTSGLTPGSGGWSDSTERLSKSNQKGLHRLETQCAFAFLTHDHGLADFRFSL